MTNNNPIQVLMEEHEKISSVEKTISKLDKLWETDKDNYRSKIKDLLEFFRIYSDDFHHQKEEKILFKELRENPDFRLEGILTELEEHHESFRDTVKDIEKNLIDDNFEKVQNLLKQYMNDLLDHIAVENDELFIMAETLFNENELERIYFLFEDIDREIGLDRKIELTNRIKMI